MVLFSFEIEGIVDDVEEATSTFLSIQDVVQDSEKVDRRLSFGFYIHEKSWTLWGVYLGDKSHFESHVSTMCVSSNLTNRRRLYDGILESLRKMKLRKCSHWTVT